MKKKGQVTIYIFWLLAAIVLVTIAGLIAPMGVLFNAEMLGAGQDILLMANQSIQDIENATIRDSITGSISEAFEQGDENITVLTDIFQYAWIIVLVLSAIVAFLFTRRLVEFGGGGFV